MTRKNKSAWAILYRWHRYTGLLISAFIIALVVTGIVLNHTDELKLDKRFIDSEWMLDWYKLKNPLEFLSFQISGHRITQVDDQVYFDSSLLSRNAKKLCGVIETHGLFVIAFPYLLILLTPHAEIVEQIPMKEFVSKALEIPSERNGAVCAIGTNDLGNVYYRTDGRLIYSDDNLLSWKQADSRLVRWSKPTTLPESIKTELSLDYRSNIVTLERVFLDVHSGRFFGRFGVYVIDFVALLLTFLATSGCLIWLIHKLRHLLRKFRKKVIVK